MDGWMVGVSMIFQSSVFLRPFAWTHWHHRRRKGKALYLRCGCAPQVGCGQTSRRSLPYSSRHLISGIGCSWRHFCWSHCSFNLEVILWLCSDAFYFSMELASSMILWNVFYANVSMNAPHSLTCCAICQEIRPFTCPYLVHSAKVDLGKHREVAA